jgi:hypothetical protein
MLSLFGAIHAKYVITLSKVILAKPVLVTSLDGLPYFGLFSLLFDSNSGYDYTDLLGHMLDHNKLYQVLSHIAPVCSGLGSRFAGKYRLHPTYPKYCLGVTHTPHSL